MFSDLPSVANIDLYTSDDDNRVGEISLYVDETRCSLMALFMVWYLINTKAKGRWLSFFLNEVRAPNPNLDNKQRCNLAFEQQVLINLP